jgi:hypothetical protein
MNESNRSIKLDELQPGEFAIAADHNNKPIVILAVDTDDGIWYAVGGEAELFHPMCPYMTCLHNIMKGRGSMLVIDTATNTPVIGNQLNDLIKADQFYQKMNVEASDMQRMVMSTAYQLIDDLNTALDNGETTPQDGYHMVIRSYPEMFTQDEQRVEGKLYTHVDTEMPSATPIAAVQAALPYPDGTKAPPSFHDALRELLNEFGIDLSDSTPSNSTPEQPKRCDGQCGCSDN